MKPALLLCLQLLATACHTAPVPASAPPAVAAAAQADPEAAGGEALAQATCASCHAVAGAGQSRRSNAPPFPVVVNQEGVTAETLSTWLRGAHNYPTEMDFHLGDPEVRALVAYLLTLRDPNYERPADW